MLSYRLLNYPSGVLNKIYSKTLSNISVSYELDQLPVATLTLPATEYVNIFDRKEIIIKDEGKCWGFRGLFDSDVITKESEAIDINFSHILEEWQYERVPMNIALKQNSLSSIYQTPDIRFVVNGWNIILSPLASTTLIEYLFSKQTKLSALSDVIKQTETLHFRVPLNSNRDLEVGEFGQLKPYIITNHSQISSGQNIAVLKDLVISRDYSKIVNQVEVYSGNVGNGMGQVTLREINDDVTLQNPSFPVGIGAYIPNDELTYSVLDTIQVAPNNNLSYIITDLASVARENGKIYEGAFQYNDLYPIPFQDQEITNADRIEITKRIYARSIRKLIANRRKTTYSLGVGTLNCDINVGDKIRLKYNNTLLENTECGTKVKNEVVNIDKELYILKLVKNFDETGLETNDLVLCEDLFSSMESI